jgi:P pilus assembly chaperone PapD
MVHTEDKHNHESTRKYKFPLDQYISQIRIREEWNTMKIQNDQNYYISFKNKLNINDLKSLIKRHRLTANIKKEDQSVCDLQVIHLNVKKYTI